MPQVANLSSRAESLFQELEYLPLARKVEAINCIRQCLCKHSPFSEEPVDCVQWIPSECIKGNDYNPNTIAPPEMNLLVHSISLDGFTQPIVTHQAEEFQHLVVDGFHRYFVGRRPGFIRERLHGYLPIVDIRRDRGCMSDRIAATIRHNRARGLHGVLPMTDIVVKLLQSGWTDSDVARELGMDSDEVLRFKQVSGLPQLFQDHKYSNSWE